MAPYNIRIELTPTDHAAVLRITFPVKEGDVLSSCKLEALNEVNHSSYAKVMQYVAVVSAGESAMNREKRICFIEASWDNHGAIVDGGGTGGQFIRGFIFCLIFGYLLRNKMVVMMIQ